jgi:nitrogen fixation protein FixH
MSQSEHARQKQFTGWHMLALMVAFFAVIIGVNLFMAISSMRTWTGLVVENSYVASQEFNTKLANANAQAAMGWEGDLIYKDSILTFILIDGTEKPLVADNVEIALSRPIGTAQDQTVQLSFMADGTYQVPLDLASGAWNAAIFVTFTDQPNYEHRARLQVGSE